MKTRSVTISKLAMVLAIFLFMGAAASAQSDSLRHSPEKRAKTVSDKMKTELALTDVQYSKVYDLNLKYAQKNNQTAKEAGEKADKAKMMKTDKQAKNDELKAILSPEQFEKYKTMQKEMKEKAKQKRKTSKT